MPTARIPSLCLPTSSPRSIATERNRSRFVLDAVRREIQRRRREEVRRSLENPHPESSELAESGLEDWSALRATDEEAGLLDPSRGKSIRWVEGRGWVDKLK